MKKTNIYFLIDCSAFRSREENEKVRQTIKQMKRALLFSNARVKTHLICYNDKAFILNTEDTFPTKGNANLTEGLRLLENVLRYQSMYEGNQTKSVFLWYTSGKALIGYKPQLERLFRQKAFAFGLRYAITDHRLSPAEQNRLEAFTENKDRVLYHFSASRMVSLVENIKG